MHIQCHVTLSDLRRNVVEEDTDHNVHNTSENQEQVPIQGTCMNSCALHMHLLMQIITIQETSKQDLVQRMALWTIVK